MTPSMVSFRLDIDEVQLLDDINTLGHPARRAYYQDWKRPTANCASSSWT